MFFNANGASVYRASLAFIFSEMIFEGGQKCCKKVSNPFDKYWCKWLYFSVETLCLFGGVYEKIRCLTVAFLAVGMEKPVPELSVGIAVIVRLHLPVRMIVN